MCVWTLCDSGSSKSAGDPPRLQTCVSPSVGNVLYDLLGWALGGLRAGSARSPMRFGVGALAPRWAPGMRFGRRLRVGCWSERGLNLRHHCTEIRRRHTQQKSVAPVTMGSARLQGACVFWAAQALLRHSDTYRGNWLLRLSRVFAFLAIPAPKARCHLLPSNKTGSYG